MKKSIRMKLFIGINSLVLFFVFLTWILNNTCLERYYISEKKHMLIENCTKINTIYKGNPTDIALDLERLENGSGVNLTIVDPDLIIKYSSYSRIVNQRLFNRKQVSSGERTPPSPLSVLASNDPSFLSKKNMDSDTYSFLTQKDNELKIEFLTLRFPLSNGDSILMKTPLPAISESANIANKFMLFIGFLIFLLGTIWAFIFSKKFTKPILEIKNIAQSIGTLDFSKKCSIESRDEIGELGGSINFLSDELSEAITELNDKNMKLIQDIERERKIDEMRKEFVSNVSHELKTPISLIQGYAEGLKMNVNSEEQDRNFYCDVIINESSKMNTLVKDLLILSQMESGYSQLEKTIFNLSSLIDQILNKFRGIFSQNDISCIVNKEKNILAEGDIVKIEQVIVNYLNNAIHHIMKENIIKINVHTINSKIRVTIFNSGNPIPEEALDKIWLSFYKVDKARTRTYGGSGLGLSIVRSIQELHGNDYGVKNKEDGVEFWFEVSSANSTS